MTPLIAQGVSPADEITGKSVLGNMRRICGPVDRPKRLSIVLILTFMPMMSIGEPAPSTGDFRNVSIDPILLCPICRDRGRFCFGGLSERLHKPARLYP